MTTAPVRKPARVGRAPVADHSDPNLEASATSGDPDPSSSPVAREEVRETLIPGRAVGRSRSGKLVQRVAAETGVNAFFIPPNLPPPGESWEFKRETVRGQTDPYYLSRMYQLGWEHVTYESYPGVFAPEHDEQGRPRKGPIIREGLYLMSRPIELTREALADEKRKADERVGNAKHQYQRLDTRGAQTAEFDHSAQQASYIRQQTVTLPNPNAQNGRQPID